MGQAKRQVWLTEYFQCWNATEAARRAGYAHPNTYGPRLKQKLQEKIDAKLDELAMPAREVLARLGEHGRATMDDFIEVVELDNRGRSTAIVSLSKAKRLDKLHLIKKLTYRDNGYTLELHDAQSALQHLDRYHGGEEGKPIQEQTRMMIDDARAEYHSRALVALADALGGLLAERSDEGHGPVDAAEHAAVDGGAESGR